MGSPSIKQPAFVSLILFVAHVSLLVDCRAMLQITKQRPQQQQQQRWSVHMATHAGAVAAVGHFYLEMRRAIQTGVKTDTFDWRKKWLLCISSKRKLYNSRQRDKEDCLFYHIWLDLMNRRGSYSQLLKMKTAETHTAHTEPPEPSSALMDLLVKRKRRSEAVDPSDPLGLHSFPSRLAKDSKQPFHGQHEQDQVGAMSKETIASCDDPLRVLQPQGPISPVKTNIAEWAEQH